MPITKFHLSLNSRLSEEIHKQVFKVCFREESNQFDVLAESNKTLTWWLYARVLERPVSVHKFIDEEIENHPSVTENSASGGKHVAWTHFQIDYIL